MENYDWSQFTQRIHVKANLKMIYEAWATPARLEHWFLRNAKFMKQEGGELDKEDSVKKGDVYQWNWFGWSDETYETGTVLEANGKDFFKFIFGKAGVVSVILKTTDDDVLVELVQQEIPVDEKSKVNFHV